MIKSLLRTPLDDFLAGAGTSSGGQRLQQIGLVGSLLGILVTIGVMAFLQWVHQGRRREIAILLQVIGAAGALTIVGACIEVAGVASIGDLSWLDALTDSSGTAPMLRLVAGLLILFGVSNPATPGGDIGDTSSRWQLTVASAAGVSGAALGAVSFWFDGHTQTEGVRVAHALANLAHVVAGGVWLGGVVGLAIVAWRRRRDELTIAVIVIRFANVAAVALVIVALAGSLMTLMIIDGLSDLTRTEWGKVLIAKVAAVGVTAAIGGYNHFRLVPALERQADDATTTVHLRRTVTIEGTILIGVALLTVWLSTASTN